MPTYSIEDSDFKDSNNNGLQANTAGVETTVWEKAIPKAQINRIGAGGGEVELFLPTSDTFSGDGTTTNFALNDDVIDNPRKTDDVVVYVGGTLQTEGAGEDYTVDYDANEIDFNSAPSAGTDNIEVYYIYESGEVTVRVVSDETEGKKEELTSESFRSLTRVDQLDNPLDLGNDAVVSKPMILQVRVESDTVVATDSNATNAVVNLPYQRLENNKENQALVKQFRDQMGQGA